MPNTAQAQPQTQDTGISLLGLRRILRSAGGELLLQSALHAQLLAVEWQREKIRLRQLLLTALCGFACLLGLMLTLSALLLTSNWSAEHRTAATLLLVGLYAVGLALTWFRLQALSARREHSFAATREQFAADLDLLRSQL